MTAYRIYLALPVALLAAFSAQAQDDEKARIELIRRVSDALVRVNVLGTIEVKEKEKDTIRGTGTGFIIFENGRPYIVTNQHVVSPPGGTKWKRPPRIVGSFNSTTGTLELELVGMDAFSDLAVLQFRTREYDGVLKKRALTFAKPESLQVGQSILVVGYSQGQPGGPSATLGILGGIGRTMEAGKFGGLLQTDAATNVGNSGGPWVNLCGEVVGVHTYGYPIETETAEIEVPRVKEVKENGKGVLKLDGHTPFKALTKVQVPEGMKYARSCESAAPLVLRLIADGKIERPAPGFTYATLTLDAAQIYGFPQGALVLSVDKGSPAAMASVTADPFLHGMYNPRQGLSALDVVTKIEWDTAKVRHRVNVTCTGDVLTALAQIPPGTTLYLTVHRPSPKRFKLVDDAVKKGWPLNPDTRPDFQPGADFLDIYDIALTVTYKLPVKSK